jgi:predicted RNase H-like HicB family nuclease
MAEITINEGLAWLKTLKKRHEELVALRNENAHRERRFFGSSADREIVKEPVYEVKVLDRLVTQVARESAWVAEIPALAGCYALMDTRQAALAELERLFELIAEEHRDRGQPLPADTTEIIRA